MLRLIFQSVLIAYLPGALIFRWPAWRRDRRAALPIEERMFWHIVISVAWSLAVVLVLARFDDYRLSRLLAVNGTVSGLILLTGNLRLRYRDAAAWMSWTVVLPVALVVLGAFRFFPTAEYIMGGKDPGTYINEGIQIAKTGSLYIREPVVASVPPGERELFFPDYHHWEYFSSRFQGFYLLDPAAGKTIGQFPHLFPASIAIGWDLGGLRWALDAVGIWAILGLLAVYFAGARFVGRGAAFAGTVLLGLHVLEVWFARSPGSEPATQALIFAAILATTRAHQDDESFFAPVAGGLLALLLFLRLDGFIAVTMVLGAAVAAWIVTHVRPRVGFLLPVAFVAPFAFLYIKYMLSGYSMDMMGYLVSIPTWLVAGAAVAFIVTAIVLERLARKGGDLAARAAPFLLIAIVLAAAADAWFLRHQIDCTSPCEHVAGYDALALRTFTDFFLTRWGLLAALLGFVFVVRQRFWRDPALVLVVAGFALVYFYKIRIQPFQFWMNRRYMPVVLPGMLLFIAAAAIGPMTWPWRARSTARIAIGAVFLGWLGWHYAAAAAPVVDHVEYAGLIDRISELSRVFSPGDLVLVESRNAGTDVHVMGTPLAYVYDRQVLAVDPPTFNSAQGSILRSFLSQATARYPHVYFIGGGSDLLSRHVLARPVTAMKILAPEHTDVPWDVYPIEVRTKVFDFGVYELTLGDATTRSGFAHDIGVEDDLYVLRFHARDLDGRQAMRWTKGNSLIVVPGLSGEEKEVVLTMHDGGRPVQAGTARVTVTFNNVPIGAVNVTGPDFTPYRFALPAELARAAGAVEGTAQIRVQSTTWNPHKLLGAPDSRDLGVMVSRVEVH